MQRNVQQSECIHDNGDSGENHQVREELPLRHRRPDRVPRLSQRPRSRCQWSLERVAVVEQLAELRATKLIAFAARRGFGTLMRWAVVNDAADKSKIPSFRPLGRAWWRCREDTLAGKAAAGSPNPMGL